MSDIAAPIVWLGVAVILGLLVALEIGFRLGRRAAAARDTQGAGQIGAVQGATLGLLGLLLGFSFAGAASRFIERQDLVLTEANAIGTAFLRADLLDEPSRSQLRRQLADYVDHRVRVSATLQRMPHPSDLARIDQYHRDIWKAARLGVAAKPEVMVGVLPPVNEVIDLHATRLAAGVKHLPALVLGLLLACSLLAMSVIGYGCGTTNRRLLPVTGALALLVGAALFTTIDLDYPRVGLIRISDQPLKALDLREEASP